MRRLAKIGSVLAALLLGGSAGALGAEAPCATLGNSLRNVELDRISDVRNAFYAIAANVVVPPFFVVPPDAVATVIGAAKMPDGYPAYPNVALAGFAGLHASVSYGGPGDCAVLTILRVENGRAHPLEGAGVRAAPEADCAQLRFRPVLVGDRWYVAQIDDFTTYFSAPDDMKPLEIRLYALDGSRIEPAATCTLRIETLRIAQLQSMAIVEDEFTAAGDAVQRLAVALRYYRSPISELPELADIVGGDAQDVPSTTQNTARVEFTVNDVRYAIERTGPEVFRVVRLHPPSQLVGRDASIFIARVLEILGDFTVR